MIIAQNTGGIAGTNAYLIGDGEAKQAVLFDAPDNTAGALLDVAEERGLDVIGLWLTHGHFDHVADHAVVTSRFPKAKVLIHRLEEPKLKNPGSDVFVVPITIPPRELTRVRRAKRASSMPIRSSTRSKPTTSPPPSSTANRRR